MCTILEILLESLVLWRVLHAGKRVKNIEKYLSGPLHTITIDAEAVRRALIEDLNPKAVSTTQRTVSPTNSSQMEKQDL